MPEETQEPVVVVDQPHPEDQPRPALVTMNADPPPPGAATMVDDPPVR